MCTDILYYLYKRSIKVFVDNLALHYLCLMLARKQKVKVKT